MCIGNADIFVVCHNTIRNFPVLKLHNISHLISSVKSGSDTEPFRNCRKITDAS